MVNQKKKISIFSWCLAGWPHAEWCAIAVEPPGAGWSQGAGGQRGVAGFEQLGIEPGFAQQMWLGACRFCAHRPLPGTGRISWVVAA